ncbi:MAG: hypothetical protein ACJASM_002050 [Salibacteraceae bacterium]|jgi:hypothetical protein
MKNLQEVLKEGNSTINQGIQDRFIDIHVNSNVNQMVEYVLSKSYEDEAAPFDQDDIENMFSLPEYNGTHARFEGGSDEDRNEEVERLESLLNDEESTENHIEGNDDQTEEKIQEEIDELNDLESAPQDVFEWWQVSDFLCGKLKDLGHPVIENQKIWGRCTTGQAISLDYSITNICANMGILDGQESSWA